MGIQQLLLAGGPWSPSMLTTLRGWWVADNPSNTLVSGELSTLADKSGNGNNAAVLSGLAQNRATLVSSGLNSRTIWRSDSSLKRGFFNPSDQSVSNAASGITVGIVHRTNPAQGTTDLNIFRINTNAATTARGMLGRGLGVASNSVYCGGRRLDADTFASAHDTTDYGNNWLVVVGILDYANAACHVSVNGVLTSNNSFQTPGNSPSNNSLSTGIGHRGDGFTTSAAYGDYAECVLTKSALGTVNRQRLEGWLAWQWGLQANLPPTHPYYSAPP